MGARGGGRFLMQTAISPAPPASHLLHHIGWLGGGAGWWAVLDANCYQPRAPGQPLAPSYRVVGRGRGAVGGALPRKNAGRPVSRVLSAAPRGGGWPFIWDACRHAPRATNPDGGAGNTPCPARAGRAVPIRSCSGRGLPCRSRRRERGALLPHPFTLAALHPDQRTPCRGVHVRKARRSAFCGAFPEVRRNRLPRRALPGALFPWSPDFPPGLPPVSRRRPGGHPADQRLSI